MIQQIVNSGGMVGENFNIGNNVIISGTAHIKIGNNVSIGSGSFIRSEGGLEIEDNVIISRNLVLYTNSHNYEGKRIPFDETYVERPIVIEKNTWVGMNVTISPGSIIGEGSIIGLGSRIYGTIPKLSVVGIEAPKIIKTRNKKHYENRNKNKEYGDKDGKSVK